MKRTALRGFTLIEMIVALTIFATLMSVLMATYSQGLSLWERGTRRASDWQSLEYRYALLGNLFAQAQAADYQRTGGMFAPHFLGYADRIEFVSRAPIFDLPGRVRVVELSVSQDRDNRFSLLYKEAESTSDPARGIEWDSGSRVALLSDLERARFRFEAPVFPLPVELGADALSSEERRRYRDNAEWIDRFESKWMWRMPQRVALEFVDSEGIARQWTFTLARAADAWTLEVYTVE